MGRVVIKNTVVKDPPIARLLFADTRLAIVWLVIRVWLGYQWLETAWRKVVDPQWVQTGEALKGFWTKALAPPAAGEQPRIAVGWYHDFLQSMLDAGAYTWFAKLVAYGELLVGVALILGAFVGLAAFAGAVMNWNYIMAGSASVNGIFLFWAVLLMLAWKVAGYYGLDYWLLRIIGRPLREFALDYDEPPAPASPPVRPLQSTGAPRQAHH